MDKEQAKNLIKETFENSFDKDKFVIFIENFLNHIDESTFSYHGQYIPDLYKPFISRYIRVGKFSDGENRIDILIVYLNKNTSIEHARTMQRNFIAGYLQGKYGSTNEKNAALVAFVSLDKADWRFSLVKLDYLFKKRKDGIPKAIEEFTPARRWSFLVGENEKSHTAQSRLVDILANDEQYPTLKEIEKAFDIETVTKEFFLKYRELFLHTKEELDQVVKKNPKIKADFENKGVDTVNFAKKLLGQIIFLYFLQKKGWFGVGRDDDWGTGSKHFLRELFEKKHGDYKNFFNDVLEHLFYDALRDDRSHNDYYFSQFDCKIPFLNGGLFDPISNYDWLHADINLPNGLFSNKNKTKEGDTGDGILDVFDRYNFTVKEDEPLEKEVAIDPELLGKAYEKFNAIRPDNFDDFKKVLKSGRKGKENKFNKKFGVYYTPREIVHYMCDQSLINYLYTELNSNQPSHKKLGDQQFEMFGNEGKIGQLDLTIEHKSATAISKKDIEALIHTGEQVSANETAVLIKKQKIINNEQKTTSIKSKFPESIKQNAKLIDKKLAEITVCDPAVGSGAFPVGMMTEIVKARNVLSIFLNDKERKTYNFKRHCIESSLYGVDIDPGAVEIAKLRLWLSLVVDEDDIKNIKPLPNLDYKIVCGNSLLSVEKNLLNFNLFNELEELKPLFFNETNPTKKQEYQKQIDKLISEITSGHTEFDFKVYFSEVFHKKGGFDVVIANPPYEEVSNKKDKVVFQKIYADILSGHYDLYIFFFGKTFNIIKDKGIISFITPHTYLHYPQFKNLRKLLYKNSSIIEITSRMSNIFESVVVDNAIILLKVEKMNESYMTKFLYKHINNGVLEDLKVYKLKKGEFDYNSFDIEAIKNKKILDHFSENSEFLGDITKSSQGITVYAKIQGKKINWFRDKIEDKNSKPVVRGRNIQRYILIWTNQYIQYGNWLWCPRNPRFFEQEKIFLRQTADCLIGTYVNEPMYCTDSVHSIIASPEHENYNLKYILAVLNSKFGNYLYKLLISETGKVFAQVKLTFLRKIPIKKVSYVEQKSFIELVNKILSLTQFESYLEDSKKQTKVKEYEHQIDQMVYKLYDLTPEEIKIAEESIK